MPLPERNLLGFPTDEITQTLAHLQAQVAQTAEEVAVTLTDLRTLIATHRAIAEDLHVVTSTLRRLVTGTSPGGATGTTTTNPS